MEEYKRDTLQSNMIRLNGQLLEEWLGAKVGKSNCCDVCGPNDCRTVHMGKLHKASLSIVPVIATLCLMFFTLSAFGADYQSGVSATVLKNSSVTGNGQKIVYPVTDKAEVTAMTVNLAPGAETGWHSHPIPVYAYVVEGTLDVELEGGQVITYRSGDAIIEVVNTLHNGRNRGSEDVRLVVFYTGAEGTPNVVKPATLGFESK